jgi:hypothetical protein
LATHFDWAEDAGTIPIVYKPPRDLSALRSDTHHHPFASLRRRQPLRQIGVVRSRYRKPEWAGSPVVTRRHPFGIGPGRPRIPSSIIHRDRPPEPNWDTDPHFKDLTRALRALGWVPATCNTDIALLGGPGVCKDLPRFILHIPLDDSSYGQTVSISKLIRFFFLHNILPFPYTTVFCL